MAEPTNEILQVEISTFLGIYGSNPTVWNSNKYFGFNFHFVFAPTMIPTSCLSNSPPEICLKFFLKDKISHWLPFPLPGPPANIEFTKYDEQQQG